MTRLPSTGRALQLLEKAWELIPSFRDTVGDPRGEAQGAQVLTQEHAGKQQNRGQTVLFL